MLSKNLKVDLSHPSLATIWVLLIPLLVLVVYLDSESFRDSDVYSRVGWYFLLVSLAYLVRNKFVYLILLLPFFLAGVLDLLYTITFSNQFTSPVYRVIAETNQNEATEFLAGYFSLGAFLAFVAYAGVLFFLARKMEVVRPHSRKAKILMFMGLCMLLVAIQQLIYYERFRDILPGAFGQAVDGAIKYSQMMEDLNKRPELLAKYSEAITKPITKQRKIFIVVIGESAARGHHSVHGYQRDTNPRLSSIQDEIIAFDHVTSSYAVTYLALSQAMSQATRDNGMRFSDSLSLVGLAGKAGYKTWWISSQAKYEATTLSLASVADKSFYKTGYDGDLLPMVERAISGDSGDVVIFVHIHGSHMGYSERYPADGFDYFKGVEGIKIYTDSPSQKQIDVINAYDNSIRYTDYFLSKLIEFLKLQNAISGLVYFSDHGEEVYDYENFIGHELKRTTPVMFEIPFLVWVNDAYKESLGKQYENMVSNSQKQFLSENFFDFGLCFIGVNAELKTRATTPCDNMNLSDLKISESVN